MHALAVSSNTFGLDSHLCTNFTTVDLFEISFTILTSNHYSEMGIFRLSPEFQLFNGSQGHSQDLSKFAEKSFMCIWTLCSWVADALHSSRDTIRLFIPIQLARRYTVWKRHSVTRIHVFHGLEARLCQAKISSWSLGNAILASYAEDCMRKLFCFVRSLPGDPRSACTYKVSLTEVTV